MREEQENLKNLTDLTSHSFEEQAKAVKSAAEAHQAEIDRLNELADSEKGVRDAIDETLKTMRERAQLERELKSAQGGSKREIAQMEIAAAEAELKFLKAANDALAKKVQLDKQAEIAASKRLDDFKGSLGPESESALVQANDDVVKIGKVAQAIKEKMQTSFEPWREGDDPHAPISRRSNENDPFSVTVDGKNYPAMSLNEAKAKLKDMADNAGKLAAVEKEITDTLKQKQQLTNADVEHLNKLKSDAADLEASLGLKREFLPQIAAAEGQSKSSIGRASGDSLIRTGNFLGSAKGQIETLQQEANKISRQQLKVQQKMEEHLRPKHGGATYSVN